MGSGEKVMGCRGGVETRGVLRLRATRFAQDDDVEATATANTGACDCAVRASLRMTSYEQRAGVGVVQAIQYARGFPWGMMR